MTETFSTLPERIVAALDDVAPQVLVHLLASAVWEMEATQRRIGQAIVAVETEAARLRRAFDLGATVRFEASVLGSKQADLVERVTERDGQEQVVMQLVAALCDLTGIPATDLRAVIFGGRS